MDPKPAINLSPVNLATASILNTVTKGVVPTNTKTPQFNEQTKEPKKEQIEAFQRRDANSEASKYEKSPELNGIKNASASKKEDVRASDNPLSSGDKEEQKVLVLKQIENNGEGQHGVINESGQEGKSSNLKSMELEKKIEKIMEKKMTEEVDKIIEKKIERMMSEKEQIGNNQQKRKPSLSDKKMIRERSWRPTKAQEGGYPREESIDRYREEFQNRFWEIDRKTEEAKRKLIYSNSKASHNSSSNKVGYPGSKSRIMNLPPLTRNVQAERSVTPSEQDEQPSSIRGRNMNFSNLSYFEDRNERSIIEETPDMSRLNHILKAKLKSFCKTGSEEEAIREWHRLGIPSMSKVYAGKYPIEQQSFITRISHSPYLNFSGYKSRGASAKKTRLSKKLTDETSDEEGGGFGQKKSKDGSQNIASNIASVNVLANEKTGVNPRSDSYSKRLRESRLSVPNSMATNTPKSQKLNTFNKRNIIGGVSNLIKPGIQATQPKLPQQQIAKNGWESTSDQAKSNPASLVNVKKRSTSVIAEVNETGKPYATEIFGVNSPAAGRSGSRGKIDNGSLLRHVYRVRTATREESSPEDPHNKSIYSNRKYINKLLKEKGSKEDYLSSLDRKGCGFSRAKRSFFLREDRSPGPVYDLSGYKGILGAEKAIKLTESPNRRARSEVNRIVQMHKKEKTSTTTVVEPAKNTDRKDANKSSKITNTKNVIKEPVKPKEELKNSVEPDEVKELPQEVQSEIVANETQEKIEEKGI